MKEDSKEETRKAPACRINKGPKEGILIDRYFQMPGGGFLARDHFLSRVSATGGQKGGFSQKWIFKCLGEDSWRRLGFLVLGRFAGLN